LEPLHVWLFIFAGATMMVLGLFLLASERELKKQRREFDELRRNHRISEARGSETHPSAELVTRNKELVEKIASLSGQLEESKRMVEGLQREQGRLVSGGELQQQLQASQETIKELEIEQQRLRGVDFENQQLREENARLRNELQTCESQCQKLREENPRLAEDISRWQECLAETEETQRQVSILRQQLEQLQTQQAAVSKANSLIDSLGEDRSPTSSRE
jgi:chromosome segregation ATPase